MRIGLALVMLTALTAGCTMFGKADEVVAPEPSCAGEGRAVVAMTEYAFSPAEIEVPVGTVVEWANVGEKGHGPSELRGKFSIGNVLPGGSWCWTFTTADVYEYDCVNHRVSMGGMVRVV